MVHTWLSVDDHLLPRMRCWIVAVVGHVLAGSKLQHFHEAQRHAPLQEELLVERGIAAATPTAILTPWHRAERDEEYVTKWPWFMKNTALREEVYRCHVCKYHSSRKKFFFAQIRACFPAAACGDQHVTIIGRRQKSPGWGSPSLMAKKQAIMGTYGSKPRD